MKVFILYFLAIFTLSQTNAAEKKLTKTQTKTDFLLSLEDYLSLNKLQKRAYTKALQDFMVRGDFGNDPSLKTSLINLFIEKAFAVAEGDRCIFAGNMSKLVLRKNNHLYCEKPDRGTCAEGEVQCNKLLFGDNACVKPPFDNATGDCIKVKSSLMNAFELNFSGDSKDAKDRYDKFVAEIKDYCQSPLKFNIENCEDLRTRIGLLNDLHQRDLEKRFRKPKATQ